MSIDTYLQSHAIGDIPEWEFIQPEERNVWQDIAAATHGIVTLGNALTAAGTIATLRANQLLSRGNVKDSTLSAKTLLTATALYATEGIFDVLDGAGATMTATRSPLGRRADAGSDAIRIPLTVYSLAKAGILPKSAAVILAAEKASTVIPSIIANVRGNEPVVVSEGKLTAGEQRLSLGSFMLSATFHQLRVEATEPQKIEIYENMSKATRVLAWTALAGSIATALPASYIYIQAARK